MKPICYQDADVHLSTFSIALVFLLVHVGNYRSELFVGVVLSYG